jgi:cysteine desulfurase
VPGIVGFGAAAALAEAEMDAEAKTLLALKARLVDGINAKLDDVYINGSDKAVLPGTVNMSFAYVEGESLLMGINDIAVSSGSACTSASLEPSYVLKALGLGDELAHSSIRFGMGRFSTEEDVDFVVDKVVSVVTRLRELSPLWEMVQEGIDLSTVQWSSH